MREIKFRAWHTKFRKMFSAEEMGIDQLTLMPDGKGFANISGDSTQLSQIDNGRQMIPLQYTGLKDKNGKEIYESDLLSGATTDKGIEVVFSDGEFWGKESNDSTHLRAEFFSKREVIGNVYENPELLNNKTE